MLQVVRDDSRLVTEIEELLAEPARDHHIVQFYEDEAFLVDKVGHYLASGLRAGEPVIVIATEAHRVAFGARLGAGRDRAIASGQLVMLDARETLSKFMVGDRPDWSRFQAAVGGIIERSREGRSERSVRAYGEMVDLLWRDGSRGAAIALERFWNDLAKQHAFALLCAYVMGNFYKAADAEEFREVCANHSHVIPTEKFVEAESATDRMRAISALEQRARSLESEVEQRKQLEVALRDALERERNGRRQAEQSVRFNEMFAGVLGHDLRNPLGAITTGAHYIARMGTGEKTTRTAFRILSSAERMARMIDQLLDFTRLRVGDGIRLNLTRLDLAELCSRVKEEIEAAHPDCVVQLETEGDTIGLWDYDRLLQVFSNLVGNAVHHGTSACTVRVIADGKDPRQVDAVVHNAGAIPPEIMPVLFEPFRGSNKQPKTRGLGLGLYISRQIVFAHGGDIEAISDQTAGTTFKVKLPRSPTGT